MLLLQGVRGMILKCDITCKLGVDLVGQLGGQLGGLLLRESGSAELRVFRSCLLY